MVSHCIGLAGLPGSGKSTAATSIVNGVEAEATHTEMSDFVRARFEAENDDEVNDNELGRWAAEQKREFGQDHFAAELAAQWEDFEGILVVSGLRSPEEASALRDAYGVENTTIVAIWTLPALRFERKYGDEPSEEHPEWDTFQERSERELHEWGCINYYTEDDVADYVLPNNASETMFRLNARDVACNVIGEQHFFPPTPQEPPLSLVTVYTPPSSEPSDFL